MRRLSRFKPFARWWWFGGAVEKPEIEYQLREMRRSGFGGIEIQPVYPLSVDEERNLPWLSKEFLAMVSFAANTATRLGLTVDVTLGSGWPFGGPHVPKEEAARKVRYDFWDLTEGQTWSSGDKPLEPDEESILLKAAPLEQGVMDLSRAVDLLHPHAVLQWTAPAGNWKVARYASSYTRMMVKRATVGAEGWVLDHYSRKAMETHFREVGEKLARATRGKTRCFFSDSWEVFGSNWTERFPEEFRRRRGYELLPYLPALDNEVPGISPGLRYDYWNTLSELTLEDYMMAMQEWCHAKGAYCRIQAHGEEPADIIKCYGELDIPECESELGWSADSPLITKIPKMASSAAHLYGRSDVSCETYTYLRRPRYLVPPRMLKVVANRLFCHGVNHLIYHGYPYSPRRIGSPGWAFYAETTINHNSPWWPYVRYLNARNARLGRELHRGTSTADVLIYTSLADIWCKMASESKPTTLTCLMQQLGSLPDAAWGNGYDFDIANDEVLLKCRASDGGLSVAGLKYRLLLVPQIDYIPIESMRKLLELARQKAPVLFVGKLPTSAPHSPGAQPHTSEMEAMKAELERMNAVAGSLSPALAQSDKEVGPFLRRLTEPDVELPSPDLSLLFVHRRCPSEEVYFLSNSSDQDKVLDITFRVKGLVPYLIDPETGRQEQCCVYRAKAGRTALSLRFVPYGSHLIAFRKARPQPHLLRSDLPVVERSPGGGLLVRAYRPGSYAVTDSKGQKRKVLVKELPQALNIAQWSLNVEGRLRARRLDKPCSWTEIPEIKGFSGPGIYRATFHLPKEWVARGIGLELDLGDVREVATVRVNGKLAGRLWTPPNALDITRLVRKGSNSLRVEVSNLLINKVLDFPDPDLSELERRYGRRFPPPGEKAVQPQPSGILGPVAMKPFARVRVG